MLYWVFGVTSRMHADERIAATSWDEAQMHASAMRGGGRQYGTGDESKREGYYRVAITDDDGTPLAAWVQPKSDGRWRLLPTDVWEATSG